MQALAQDAKAALQSLRLALQSVCGQGPQQSVPAPQAGKLSDSGLPGPVLSPAAQAELRDQAPTWVPLQRNLWLAPKPKKLARAQIHVRQLECKFVGRLVLGDLRPPSVYCSCGVTCYICAKLACLACCIA